MTKSLLLGENREALERVYSPALRRRLCEATDCAGAVTDRALWGSEATLGAEAVFSTWGMPSLTPDELARFFPRLRAVFYAAGSVRAFAPALFERGVRVFSAWQANAVPVAEFTFAQIALALKGYFLVQALTRTSREEAGRLFSRFPGGYESSVGLIGCGAVGRRVAQRLGTMDVKVCVCDPYLSEADAARLRVIRTDMDTLFSRCDVISNHLPNIPSTVGLIRREHFMSMKPTATFINTGRGPQLTEKDLYDALTAEPARTALLDVMTDEIHSDTNPLNALPNCFITPHMAGSAGQEVWRMAAYMLDELRRWERGEPCPNEVTPAMLQTMA